MGFYEIIYPEANLFGFPTNDHEFNFFCMVNQIIEKDFTVLDFGAGRGKYVETSAPQLGRLKVIKGKVKKVIGADIQDDILENSYIDEAIVFDPYKPLPFPDESFDMIVSISVFEHIEDPKYLCEELKRVLKPGGCICALTPNKWGYVAIAASIIPDYFRGFFLREFAGIGSEGNREMDDVFPTFYRLNTIKDLNNSFKDLENYSYYFGGPPAYTGGRMWLGRCIIFYEWLMPKSFLRNLHIFLRKPKAS